MIGVGANLNSGRSVTPMGTCTAALAALDGMQVSVVRRSRWYRSAPVPISDQPPFVNGVIEVTTEYNPQKLLRVLHAVEATFGREREVTNAARVLDLDLLTYNDEVTGAGAAVRLPHPRMHERAFVLRPLIELAPNWNHPILGLSARELLDRIPSWQIAEPIKFDPSNDTPV